MPAPTVAAPTAGPTATTGAGAKSKIIGTFFGVLFLSVGLIILLMEVQTSEAFLLQGGIVSFHPNWQIATQPYYLFMGGLDFYTAKATVWGWGIELTSYMCIVGWEVARHAISHYNPKLVGWLRTGAIALFAFNCITSYSYGNLASGFWGQAGFALLTAFGAGGLPLLGTYMLERTWAAPTAAVKKSPIPGLLVGVVLVAFGVSIILMEIQASEAFILQLPVTTFASNLATLQQPIDLVKGTLSIAMAEATIWGWVTELVYFVCIVGWEIAGSAFGYHSPKLEGWFKGGAIALTGFNILTNLFYGTLPSGLWGQAGFAVMTSFGSAFFPIVGVYLIERSLTK